MIYFIQSKSGGPIKIGFAKNVQARLRALQIGSPVPLRLLGSIKGEIEDEKTLHKKFASVRLYGEWFYPSKELLAFLATKCTIQPIKNGLSPTELFVREEKAAEITGMAIATLRNNRHKRKGLPYYKIGRSVRYKLKDISEYMETHRIQF